MAFQTTSDRARLFSAVHDAKLVLIDGGTASGKTSLANLIADTFPPCVVISHDSFMLPRETRADLYDELSSGAITPGEYDERTWDWPRLGRLVSQVIGGSVRGGEFVVTVPIAYQRDATTQHREAALSPQTKVVIEGSGSLRWNAAGLKAVRVWCELPDPDAAIARKVTRAAERGAALSDAQIADRYLTVERVHDSWVAARSRASADFAYLAEP